MTEFKEHILNLNDLVAIKNKIKKDGIVFFKQEFDLNTFSQLGRSIGEIYSHRDSSTHGITIVKTTEKKVSHDDGYLGLTNNSLFPHTDRSTLENPPNILILFCKEQSCFGGDTSLVDMKKVLQTVISKYGENNPLVNLNNVIFHDDNSLC